MIHYELNYGINADKSTLQSGMKKKVLGIMGKSE